MLSKHIQYKVRITFSDYQPPGHCPPGERPLSTVRVGTRVSQALLVRTCTQTERLCTCTGPAPRVVPPLPPAPSGRPRGWFGALPHVSHPRALPAWQWVRSPLRCHGRSQGNDSQSCSPYLSRLRPAQSTSMTGPVRMSRFFFSCVRLWLRVSP